MDIFIVIWVFFIVLFTFFIYYCFMEIVKNYNDVVDSKYEVFGFYQDVFVDGKFLGCINSDYQPGRAIGYAGRSITEVVDTFITSQKKVVKKGQKITTYYYPLCGKKLN